MHLYMLGISYKTADVEMRERVTFRPSFLPHVLKRLCAQPAIEGAVILSTCNRMEVYVDAVDPKAARDQVCAFLGDEKGVSRSDLEPHIYDCSGTDVVRHLLLVAASLDSMVLGEQQIAGQVRTAFRLATEAGCCTLALGHLFRQALGCSKRVRNQTAISESRVSVSTVAIDLVQAEFDTLEGKTVLIVGAGEMSELAARYLRELGVSSFIISSRTYGHARKVAAELGGTAHLFEDLPRMIPTADIIISSTAAPHYVITPDLLEGAGDHHIFILDIALPRDVDPACDDLDHVSVIDLDDIRRQVERNKDARVRETNAAAAIIDEEVAAFEQWTCEHAVIPTVKRIRQDAEEVRAREVDRLLHCLQADVSDQDKAAIEAATKAIVKKLLHTPTVRLKQSASENASFECVEAVHYLFGYSDGIVGHAHELDAGASDDQGEEGPDAVSA